MCSGVSFCGAPAGAHPGHIQGARPEKDPRAAGVLRGRVRRTIPRHPRSAAGVRAHIARARRRRPQLCQLSRVRCEHEDLAFRPAPYGSGRGSTRFYFIIWIFRRSETRETAESIFACRRVTAPKKDPVRAQEKWNSPPTVRKPCGFLVVCHLAPRSRHWPSPLTHQDAASDRARLRLV